MREKDKNESMMLLRYTRTQYASFYKFFFPLLAREEHLLPRQMSMLSSLDGISALPADNRPSKARLAETGVEDSRVEAIALVGRRS
jgi:hypothetical protein